MNIIRLLTTALLAALAASPARAQITFTNIADNTSPTYDIFTDGVSINSSGTVGFLSLLDMGGQGLFTSNGTTTTTIALSSSPTFSSFFGPSINAAGTLGFFAFLDPGAGGPSGLFTSDGTNTTTIALSGGANATYSSFAAFPSINSAGKLGFYAVVQPGSGGGEGLFIGDGTTTTTIAQSNGPTYQSFAGNGSLPGINAAGTLGFYAQLDPGAGGGFGLFRSDGTTTTVINQVSNPVVGVSGSISINTAGYLGFLGSTTGTGELGVFTSDGTTTTTIALESSPTFSSFGESVSINTTGAVSFVGMLEAGGHGIYVGDGITTTEVIKTGDALFGSTVTDLTVTRQALNDAGQVAFQYTLADGRQGVAVANTVPEPGSVLLLFGGAALFGMRRRR